ncbi:MAG: type III pantothenate kinase [Clostridia bacterium]|nr:type III pantothenate kinase [Clostridia bacterium]
MILALDVGNTNIVFGCIDNGEILFEGRISTDRGRTEMEYAVILKSSLDIQKINPSDFDGAIISSVVPPIDAALSRAIKLVCGCEPYVINVKSNHGLIIDIDRPETLGNDLITGAVAALAEYKPPIILFDLGTATTISVIDKNSHYAGGIITTGLKLSQQALSANASQLPGISLGAPDTVIGKNTEHAMRSGLIIGCAAMMDGMIDRIEEELGEKATVVTTGGFGAVVTDLCRHKAIYDKDLLLKGLWIMYNKQKNS